MCFCDCITLSNSPRINQTDLVCCVTIFVFQPFFFAKLNFVASWRRLELQRRRQKHWLPGVSILMYYYYSLCNVMTWYSRSYFHTVPNDECDCTGSTSEFLQHSQHQTFDMRPSSHSYGVIVSTTSPYWNIGKHKTTLDTIWKKLNILTGKTSHTRKTS